MNYLPKKIVILGSTGSIGTNAIIVSKHLAPQIQVVGLVANHNISLLAQQAIDLQVDTVITSDKYRLASLKEKLPEKISAATGENAIIDLVTRPDVDLIICAIVGVAGLSPVLAAIRHGKTIALASKEVLVMAGDIVMSEAQKYHAPILPIDSEHSAILQCMHHRPTQEVSRLILTASGGPFQETPYSQWASITPAQALKHPTWNMGKKISIDSATLMNKALEIIEAHHLFNMPGNKIDVLIHPQSIIHSLVEFIDHTILAQMGEPNMRPAIQYTLTYPQKLHGTLTPFDFSKALSLSFFPADKKKFPSIQLAYDVLQQGGTAPAVLNAANEVAVQYFLEEKISFPQIFFVIENTLSLHQTLQNPTIDAILSADQWARKTAASVISSI